MLSGVWGASQATYLNGGLVFSRTPVTGTRAVDTYYQANLGLGHAIDNIAFDAGFIGSVSPLTAVLSKGGYIGATYIVVKDTIDPATHSDNALMLLRTQIYPEPDNQPLFWVRVGFAGNTMSSRLVSTPDNNARGTIFSLDATYPVNPELTVGAGLSLFGYDSKSRRFFSEAQRHSSTLGRYMLGATVQGLPHSVATVNFSQTITNRDTFVPRYSATELDATRTWTHTIDLGWRHQFTKKFFLTPTYELTIQGNRAFTGFLLDFMHML